MSRTAMRRLRTADVHTSPRDERKARSHSAEIVILGGNGVGDCSQAFLNNAI